MKCILKIAVFLFITVFAVASEELIEKSTLDELIEKMQNAPKGKKYLYMNQIKMKLRALKKVERREAITAIKTSMQNHKSNKQSSQKEGHRSYGNKAHGNGGFGRGGGNGGKGK